NDPKVIPLLDLPTDILRHMTSLFLDEEATQIKRKLSMTCKPLYSFFQQDLAKRDAQRLLTYVLQGDARKAKKMYEANPQLLFLEATAKDYAAGLDEHGKPVPRIVSDSPFKAAARAGDIWMLQEMKER